MVEKTKDYKLEKNLKLIAKTSMVVFIGIFLSKLLMYIYKIIIARYFGPEIYGVFSLSIMVLGWILSFAALGLSEGFLRFVPLYRGEKGANKIKSLFRFSMILLISTSIFSGLILFFLADFIAINFFHNALLGRFLKYFSFLIPAYLLSTFFVSTLRSFEKISLFSFLTNIFQNVIKVGSLGLFIFLGFKVNSVIFSYLVGIFSLLIVSYFVCKKKTPEIFGKSFLDKKAKSNIISDFFSYSWPLMFFSFSVSIFPWIDSFAIGFFKNVYDVGIYNAAVPIAFLLYFAPEIFVQLFFPLITKEFSRKNLDLIRELSKQVGKWIFALNLPFLLILIAFPGAIINLLFGPQYIEVEQALRILSFGVFLASIFRISDVLIAMKGKSKIILINIVVASTINLFLNFLLVPKYGLIGAALSTTISYVILSMMQMFEAKHYLSIVPLKREIIKILLVSMIPLTLLLIIKQFLPSTIMGIILQGIFFVLVYILLILSTKCLDKNDWMILKTIKNKLFFK
ncbi:MAG: flippase [Nanoarchaeota archaeon]|nr:flippase [Nanoarchaeota archaeon]MBU1028051.1 flippase [Nanoarchaeota archaeon]